MQSQPNQGFIANLNPAAPLRGLFVHRELLRQFTLRNFQARHKGSYLGIAWAVLNPLLQLCLYFVVFRLIFGGHFGVLHNETKADYALAMLLGLTVYRFVAEIIGLSPTIVVINQNLVKKVVFPVEVLPVANLGACCFDFAISFGLVVLGMLIFGRGIPASAVWLPVIVLPLLLLAAGLSWFLAALGVFFRDITQVTQFLSIILMYASAVFYPSTMVRTQAPRIWAFLRFNPLIHEIEQLRNVMLWNQPVNLVNLGWLYVAGLAACIAGYACFAALRPAFADVL